MSLRALVWRCAWRGVLGLAVVSFAFIGVLAPETKGRPLEAIRVYWENGGHWPPEEETVAALDQQRREERGGIR